MSIAKTIKKQNPSLPKTSRRIGFSWPLLVGILGFLLVTLNQQTQFLDDPDSLLHITAGNWIINHNLVPQFDPFSFNTKGKLWIDHEWLSQVLWAYSYNLGGFFGVRLLAASLFALTLAIQLRYLLIYVPAIYGLLFSAICYLSLQNHLLARPHLMTWPILIAWFSVLLESSTRRTKPPLLLLPLMTLWANLHGSFLLGLALIPFISIDAIIYSDKAGRPHIIKEWIIFFGLASLASMITPYGLRGWQFGIELMSSAYITRIVEWAPSSGSTLLCIEAWLIILLVLGFYGKIRFTPGRLLIALGLLHEAFAHVRYISIFGLLIPLLIAEPFGKAYPDKFKTNHAVDRFFHRLCTPAKKKACFIATICCILISAVAETHHPFNLKPEIAPAEALAKVRDMKLSGNVLNAYKFGGYLIFKDIPVFIDGRADLHGTPENNDYYPIASSSDTDLITSLLKKHAITWAIFPSDDRTLLYFENQPAWSKIYSDKFATVFSKRPQESP